MPEDDPIVLDTIEELEVGIKAENEGGKATWAECFSARNMLWKRTMNGMMLQFIQQLNGQNFYCERLYSEFFGICLTLSCVQITTVIHSSRVRALSALMYNSTLCALLTLLILRLSPYVIQVILGAVSVIGTVPALYLIETFGRRKVSGKLQHFFTVLRLIPLCSRSFSAQSWKPHAHSS